jgi:triosephosphate isomerase
MSTPLRIGVSLKLYFGYAQTLDWCSHVAQTAAAHPALQSGAVSLFVLPSFPAIPAVAAIFAEGPVAVGAQDLGAVDGGAYTGEVSGAMLAELGARYVEVGHAERRRLFGEDESVVADKTAAALRNGLVPVLCLGEGDRGPATDAADECVRQLHSALAVADREGFGGPVLVAYEPHWAIGAAEPAGDDHIVAVCAALRDALAATGRAGSQVIYGGSAGPGLLTRLGGGVDGLFLGRFAHDPTALAAVLDEAEQLVQQTEVAR